jgi:hypothetical protein
MTSVGVFIWQFILAWLLAGLAIYLPGRLLLRLLKVPLMPLEHLAASLISGAGLLVLVYWAMSLGQVQWLLWAYVLAAAGSEAWLWSERLRRDPILLHAEVEVLDHERLRVFWPLYLLAFLGVLAQGRYMFWTAWPTAHGLDILAWHATDAPWHVFNIFHLARVYPPELAGFSGNPLINYHMLSHLLWGAIRHLAPVLDAWHLYFRIAPVFYSALITLSAFVAARAWSGKLKTAYLASALVLFSANFGYLMPLIFGAQKYGIWDSIFWVQSPMGMIFNPSVSSSFLFLFMGLWALTRWVRERHLGFLVLVALLWGVMPGFKVYPGLLMIVALFMVAIIRLIWQRDWSLVQAWLAVLPVFLFVFLPPNLHAPSLIKFLPGFNLGTMLVAPDRMALMSSYDLKLLYAHHRWLVALIMAGLFAVFFVGNLGVRAMALPSMFKSFREFHKTDPILLFIGLLVVGAFAAPVLFVQKGVQWNTVQFAYFGLALASLPAAEQFWVWAEPWTRWKQYTALALVIALGLPCAIQSLCVVNWNATLSPKMLEALMWLKDTGTLRDVVLRPLPDAYRTEAGYKTLIKNQVRGSMTSLSVWDKEAKAFAAGTGSATTMTAQAQGTSLTAAAALAVDSNSISAQAAPAANTTTAVSRAAIWEREDCMVLASTTFKNSYLEGTVTSQILGYPVEKRAREIRHFYETSDAVEAREFLEQGHIRYVLLYPEMKFPFSPEGVSLKLAFENEAVKIYKYVPRKEWE